MADPIREALRILLNEIDDLSVLGKIPSLREAVDEARTALAAEPPAPGPTIDDIWQLCEDHEFHLGMDGANEEESAEGLLEIINTALGRWGRPAPAPAADGERDHVPDAGDMVAADGEREELAAWLDEEAKSCAAQFHDRITRAAALLREAHPQPGWRPISTAPKDGTEILASDYDTIEIVNWSWDAWETGSGWIDRDGRRLYPAWWQPLPERPPIPTEPTTTETANG